MIKLIHSPEAEFSETIHQSGLIKVEYRFIAQIDLEDQFESGKKLRSIVEKFHAILLEETENDNPRS